MTVEQLRSPGAHRVVGAPTRPNLWAPLGWAGALVVSLAMWAAIAALVWAVAGGWR